MITFTTHTVRARFSIATSASALLAAALLFSTVASAQSPAVDARWQPFLGCWVPDQSSAAIGSSAVSGSMVCLVPVANSQSSVDVATINNRVVVHRERITTNGEHIAKKADDCPGWESASWSADGHRIFMRSEYACGSNLSIKGSGVFAIASNGDWVQVQGTAVGLNAGARVVRFRQADVALAPGSMITDSSTVTTVPAPNSFTVQAMRSAAGAPTDPKALLDIAKHVDEQVAQAWLSEFGVATKLNAQQLVAMADAGMPTALTDMMVAMANPERFQIKTRSPDGQVGDAKAVTRVNDDRCNFDYLLDPRFDVSPMTSFDRRYCMSKYGSAYGYPFGYLSGWRYGWGNYGYGYGSNYYGGNYYYGSQPIIIVTRNPDGDVPLPRGRAVKGGGYSSGSSGSSSTQPRQSSSPSSGSSSSGSSGSGSTSTSGGSGTTTSGGDSGARTAKPRPPGGN